MVNNSTLIHQQTEQFYCYWFLVFIIHFSHCSAIPLQPDLMGHEFPGRYNELTNESHALGRYNMYMETFTLAIGNDACTHVRIASLVVRSTLTFQPARPPYGDWYFMHYTYNPICLVSLQCYKILNLFVLLSNSISFGKMKHGFIS